MLFFPQEAEELGKEKALTYISSMNIISELEKLRSEVLDELESNILPFWTDKMQDPRGGFFGRITGEGEVEPDAARGAILNARILWAFSAAYRVLHRQEYLDAATRAKREIIDRFYDREFGGIYWSIGSDGKPQDDHKQFYAIGFAIYGLSEYARATGDSEALDYAIRLYNDIEAHSLDIEKNGYIEAAARDWSGISDMRLSSKDANERKTMNTHLHIIEPYTALYRVWPDEGLKESILNLLYIFREKILSRDTGHLQLFFDDDWNSRCDVISYGHDIEASWLLYEAAEVIGDEDYLKDIVPDVRKIADSAAEGYIEGGGMLYEFHADTGAVDADRHWWVQAETVVGYLNIFRICDSVTALKKALGTWGFIRRHIVDRDGGEWFWSLKADGTTNRTDDKAGFWKCPYHNSRMCLEVIRLVDMITTTYNNTLK